MQTIAPESRLYVVVGVVKNRSGKYLLQQRPPGKPCEGQWEFPGGKLEAAETPLKALARELKEELGIDVMEASPLTQIKQDYEHARVWLDVYLVESYVGDAEGREEQLIAWLDPYEILEKDILPPVIPIIESLLSG